jgi:hypothetical protein
MKAKKTSPPSDDTFFQKLLPHPGFSISKKAFFVNKNLMIERCSIDKKLRNKSGRNWPEESVDEE